MQPLLHYYSFFVLYVIPNFWCFFSYYISYYVIIYIRRVRE